MSRREPLGAVVGNQPAVLHVVGARPLSIQPRVIGQEPHRQSTLISNQMNRNASRQRLPDTILRALAGRQVAMERDAQIGPNSDHLSVPRRPRDVAQCAPVGRMNTRMNAGCIARSEESCECTQQ
jgi:hypothetical protein